MGTERTVQTASRRDGFFRAILGDEERRIREDPAARTTALVRRVFGPTASG